LKNLILRGMSRQRHVVKVAYSTTVTWQKPCHFNVFVGQRPFLNKKEFTGIF